MGYTRYWNVKRDLDDFKFLKFKEICNEIITTFNIPLDDIVLNNELIRFNGVEDDAHETFLFSKNEQSFIFCKTQRKPYDEVVLACLLTASIIFGEDISISSDGDNNDSKVKEKLIPLIRNKKLTDIL